MLNQKEKGFFAEKIAVDFLQKQGYKILAQNWKLKNVGEIDIIALKKNLVNFIEVKSLYYQDYFLPEQHFTFKKLEKIKKLASFFANKHNFDLWIISLLTISFSVKDVKIKYYENIEI